MGELQIVKRMILDSLNLLYSEDKGLFAKSGKLVVCERCIVFRFAHYLQNILDNNYFVDCDFNRSYQFEKSSNGNIILTTRTGKHIQNSDGSYSQRFIDVIIHKRTGKKDSGYFCIEIIKQNNKKGLDKDRNNLIQLTSNYFYKFGFLLFLGDSIEKSEWIIFSNGSEICPKKPVNLPAIKFI